MAARVELELQVAVVAVHHSPSNEPSIFPGPNWGPKSQEGLGFRRLVGWLVGWLVGYITQRCFFINLSSIKMKSKVNW